jgi:glutamate dehydrogenase (NAD(P)+)
VRVVAVADAAGTVVNAGGLDVEHLLRRRSVGGLLDRSGLRAADQVLPPSAWLTSEADILVTAAVPYAVDDRNHAAVAARYVVEGANISLTSGAEEALGRRGVTVVPDIAANCGTSGWWWWTLFGDVAPTAEASFTRIATVVSGLVEAVLSEADQAGTTPRRAATRIAEGNMALLDAGVAGD